MDRNFKIRQGIDFEIYFSHNGTIFAAQEEGRSPFYENSTNEM
jgi:hypothetical protein